MRIFPKLFLLVSGVALASVLAVAGVLSWNLDRGFSEYLDARDAELLGFAAADFEEGLAELNGGAELDADMLRSTIERMAQQGRIRELSGPPPPRREIDEAERDEGGPGDVRRGGPRGPPPDAFGRRLRLYDRDDNLLFGPPPGPAHLEVDALSRPILLNEEVVATMRVLPRGPTPGAIDARFLRNQHVGVAVVSAILLALSGVFAWFLARAGARQISALQSATHSIATGEFGERVDVQGSDEIAELGRGINDMAESLERLEGARRHWLAEISHELRTPLTVLKGELEALKDGIRPIDRGAILSLSEEAERLGLLIDDLHFLAVSDLGGAPTHFENFDASDLLRNAASRFEPAVAAAGLELVLDERIANVPVSWDKQRLEQLLGNLITNSVRYTDAPGRVRVNMSVEDGLVTLAVEDSAPGVPAETCNQLFEPLYRVEESRDRQLGGSGLGLSVAQAIAHAHGGKIQAAPSDLGGLKVTVTLPTEAREA